MLNFPHCSILIIHDVIPIWELLDQHKNNIDECVQLELWEAADSGGQDMGGRQLG